MTNPCRHRTRRRARFRRASWDGVLVAAGCVAALAAVIAVPARIVAGSTPPVRVARADELLQDYPPALPAAGRIVYTRQAADAFDMFTADPDGLNETRLSDISESAAGEDQPRWSPDGKRVSFATFRDGGATYHIMDALGGAPRTVVLRDGVGGDAAWSPDGRCLVYNGGRAEDETRFDLKVWCDDGTQSGARRNVTDTADTDERDPDWSPDGTRILFVALPHEPSSGDRWTLQAIRPDGTDRSEVLSLPDEHIRFPRFDPAGERIGFIGSRQNLPFGTLSVYDPFTARRDRLCELASDAWSWSPDGSEILFANISNGGVRLSGVAPDLASWQRASPWARRPSQAVQALSTQYKGLYRIDVASRSVGRLGGAAGGAQAPNSATNFEFGFMPDWTSGTAAPTAAPSATPTATDAAEPTASPPDTPVPTWTPVPPTATATATATATGMRRVRRVFLPRLFRALPSGRR